MKRPGTHGHDEKLTEAAAKWAVLFASDEPLSDADYDAFDQWLLSDSRNGPEFAVQSGLLQAFPDFPEDLQAKHRAWLAQQIRRRQMQRRWRRAGGWALAATLLLGGFGIAWHVLQRYPSEVYSTATGETQLVTLADGSTARLNTRTRLKWTGNTSDRRVVLFEGEALFNVVDDAAHPFRVLVDGSEIRVLGTQFNVHRKNDGEVIVTVLQGSVQVQDGAVSWQRVLHRDQRIAYRPAGVIRDIHPVRAEVSIKWSQGMLEITDEPLLNVVNELTRYTDKRIAATDPRLTRITVSGHFSVRNVPQTLKRLERLVPVNVTDTGNTFSLTFRQPAERSETPGTVATDPLASRP